MINGHSDRKFFARFFSQKILADLGTRGRAPEDVLDLEDTFGSPWPRRSSPWPQSLKFSSVARGARAPYWPEKYAKLHVFNAFAADFCSKNENIPPRRDLGAEVVKELP